MFMLSQSSFFSCSLLTHSNVSEADSQEIRIILTGLVEIKQTRGRNSWMTGCVRCGENWGKSAYEGDRRSENCAGKRVLWGGSTSVLNRKCPVRWQPESLCTTVDLKQTYGKSSGPTGGILSHLTTELRWVHLLTPFLCYTPHLSPITKALHLAGLCSLHGYTQLVTPPRCCVGAYPTLYLHHRNHYLYYLSRDWPLQNDPFLPFAPDPFLALCLKLQA